MRGFFRTVDFIAMAIWLIRLCQRVRRKTENEQNEARFFRGAVPESERAEPLPRASEPFIAFVILCLQYTYQALSEIARVYPDLRAELSPILSEFATALDAGIQDFLPQPEELAEAEEPTEKSPEEASADEQGQAFPEASALEAE